MLAFAPSEARGLIFQGSDAFVRANFRARAAFRLGLFFSCSAAIAGCGTRDPEVVAKAADARAGTGLYAWLARHDPSSIVLVGVDPETTRAVAPDARIEIATDVTTGCKRALAVHALLAARVAKGSTQRDRADDCGFGLFRDDAGIVIAPR